MTEALVLRGLRVPGEPEVRELRLRAGETSIRHLPPDLGASFLRAVAGVRNRGPRRVTVDEVWVDGEPMTEHLQDGQVVGRNVAPELRPIGFVPAGCTLLPHSTVRENIIGNDRQASRANLIDVLADKLELHGALHLLPQHLRYPDEYLRVALARAALGEPVARLVHVGPVPGAHRLLDLLKLACVGPTLPATIVVTDQEELRDDLRQLLDEEARHPPSPDGGSGEP